MLKNAKYLGINPTYDKPNVKTSYIYETEVAGEKSWLIVREYFNGDILFHGCSSDPQIATGLI